MQVRSFHARRATAGVILAPCLLIGLQAVATWPAQAQELAPVKIEPQTTTPAPQTPAAQAGKKQPQPKSLVAWRSKVIAHLNSRKSGAAAADGTTTVAFKIDRSGKVVSAQVVTSSGNKGLDAEAVALTQRASPVPAPPADITGATLYLKVPIRFKK